VHVVDRIVLDLGPTATMELDTRVDRDLTIGGAGSVFAFSSLSDATLTVTPAP
jgi:hypothetical protein